MRTILLSFAAVGGVLQCCIGAKLWDARSTLSEFELFGPATQKRADGFDWDKIQASPSFNWAPCFNTFQCAKFETPLDYSDLAGPKANIAVLKYPSQLAPDDPKYRGPIFYNPGGPGASGTDFVRAAGPFMSGILGDEFDHIGFDPRGVGATTPAFDLFPSQSERRSWEALWYNTLAFTPDGIGRAIARGEILGELALQRLNGTANYVSTAAAVRDIMAMNAALGRDKVMYWGGSYGTVIGLTLAAMFPEKIQRVVVDSVLDATTYYETEWKKNLLDTDATFEWLFTSCSASTACPLHETTPAGVRARYDTVSDMLRKRPVALVQPDGVVYGVVDWPMLRDATFQAFHSPYADYPDLAQAVADLENRNGSALYALSGRTDSQWRCDCTDPDCVQTGPPEVNIAIMCGDGEPVHDSYEDLEAYVAALRQTSTWADEWLWRLYCRGWRIRAQERFTGPIVANTSHPILMMTNTADPVCPLQFAYNMSQGFAGSSVLGVDAPGHGAFISPSLCMAQYLRAYVWDGNLPANGTICPTYKAIFPIGNEDTPQRRGLSAGDQDLLAAVEQLRAHVRLPRMTHPRF